MKRIRQDRALCPWRPARLLHRHRPLQRLLVRRPHGDGHIKLLAHRGVHQTFSHAGLKNDTCTAERINPPTHDFIENTLPSMEAAFAAGADVVELDVHLTPEKTFAVMHDWTVDCRTEGKGVTEELGIAYLKTLDLGYGYTADGGKTFPCAAKALACCRRSTKC